MSPDISKSPGSRPWRELYKAALYEVDRNKISGRIAQAQKAVVLRARELFQAAGDNSEETEALDHVTYALHALESNPQMQQGLTGVANTRGGAFRPADCDLDRMPNSATTEGWCRH